MKNPHAEPLEVFDQSQILALTDAARGHRLEALPALAWQTGLRIGELLALQWDEWDETRNVLTVHRTLANGLPQFYEPKTPRGIREVPLSANTLAILHDHRERQRREIIAAQETGWKDPTLVFTTELGTVLSLHDVKGTWDKWRDTAGLPRYSFHALRNTCILLTRLERMAGDQT